MSLLMHQMLKFALRNVCSMEGHASIPQFSSCVVTIWWRITWTFQPTHIESFICTILCVTRIVDPEMSSVSGIGGSSKNNCDSYAFVGCVQVCASSGSNRN